MPAEPPLIDAFPDLLIIGAQKSGTSTMFQRLALHPYIRKPKESRKELHYFDLHFDRSRELYRKQFPRLPDELSMDATPYYLFHPLAAQRAAAVVPGAKLIVLLREPAARAYSHYQSALAWGHEKLGFEDALAAEAERLADSEEALASGRIAHSRAHQQFSYFARGLYAQQIERWLGHYPREQFLFLRAEDLYAEPQQTFDRACAFLGVEPVSLMAPTGHNQRHYEPMRAETREKLRSMYQEPNARLERLVGIGWDDLPGA